MATQHSEQTEPALLAEALAAIRTLRSRVAELEGRGREPIAIVGMSCRFPGGIDSVDAYWDALSAGTDLTQNVPADRWDNDAYYDPVVGAPGKICTKRGGFVTSKDLFDAAFFRISPREAAYIDPQQRLLLETSWEALEHANIAADDLYGTDAGVFVGISSFDYVGLVFGEVPEVLLDHSVGTGSAHSAAAGRISYALGVHGPSMSVDTACSSSLVAVQLACESLRRGECGLALVGGVNMVLSPLSNLVFSRSHMLSPDGRCKTFDDAADGYARSEGAGMLVLKKLSKAVADGDRVLAVIRGAAVNQDGRSGGLTVPNGPAQRRLIARALDDAGVAASDIGYIEAHGTGTPLGDPIEMNALGELFQASHHRSERPLYVGSAKTNLGHMEAAAGVGGLIKLVLQLQRGTIAPHLHFRTPSSRIAWEALPVRVPGETTTWPRYAERRLGGVSSFGFTGTNAHVIVEEAPLEAKTPVRERRRQQLLCLSAKSESALSALCLRYARRLGAAPSLVLGDVCSSANAGRSHFEHRVAIVTDSSSDLAQRLAAAADGAVEIRRRQREACQVAFLYTGQGQELRGAGRALFRENKIFREALARCDEAVSREVGFSVVDALYGSSRSQPALDQTAYAQPLTVSLQIALTALLRSWGVVPAVVAGHSLGEYAAAHAAGILSLDDTLKLVAWRGKLMQGLSEAGSMVALECDVERVRRVLSSLGSRVAVAAVNSPSQTVISGAVVDIQAAVAQLSDVAARRLDVSHAFHSPLMRPMLAGYQDVLGKVRFNLPRIEFVSMLSGTPLGREATSPEHWLRHVLEPVEFLRGMKEMHDGGSNVFVEVGAQPTLLALGARCLPGVDAAWVPTLDKREDDWKALLSSLARLYTEGAKLDWKGLDDGERRGQVSLPTYAFERRRHWYVGGGPRRVSAGTQSHPLLGSLVADGEPGSALTFESTISATSPRYLEGHRILDHVIFPVAGYFELVLAASRALGGPGGVSLSDLSVAAPLSLQDGPRVVRTMLEPLVGGSYRVRISSRPAGDDEPIWQLHAQGTLSLNRDDAAPSTELRGSLEEAQRRLLSESDVQAADQRARERGFQYGPSFCCIRAIWPAEGEIRAALGLDSSDLAAEGEYAVHPALLDAAIQIVGPLLPGEGVYLPITVEELRYFKSPGKAGSAHLRLRHEARADGEIIADVNLFDAAGEPALGLSGLRLRPVSKTALDAARRRELTHLLYTVEWQNGVPSKPEGLSADAAASADSLAVLFADSCGTASGLQAALVERRAKAWLVEYAPCEQPQRPQLDGFVIDPKRQDHLAWLFKELEARDASETNTPVSLIYLSGLDLEPPAESSSLPLAETHLLGCGPLLNLVKAALTSRATLQLKVVTRGALAAGDASTNLAQAAIAGMVTTIRSEASTLRCCHVDLDPNLSNRTDAGEAQRLANELLTEDNEELVAFRASQRLVARLERYPLTSVTGGPVDVYLQDYGSADELILKPASRRAPEPNELEIAVRAAGLNFKDVLHVWGVLRSFCEEQGLPWVDRRKIGFECSGVVTRTGTAVTNFSVGDEVIGIGFECLNSFVTLDAASVVPKPRALSHEQAAAVPTAYLTAVYGLLKLAGLHSGESVLVHAAAGGVGQAALRVCAHVGAEVHATASPGKWDFLRAQGIGQPLSSRTLEFEAAVRERTRGRGVDVVLNSLGGEFIPASLNTLAPGGRFIEIGKRGIWSRDQVAAVRPDVRYFAFDLGDVDREVTEGLPALLREVCQGLDAQRLAPLPVQIFSVEHVGGALRTLAESKNVGKVVVKFPQTHLPDGGCATPSIRSDRTYVITGGLGGLGLETAAWLNRLGARHLALVGRVGATEKSEPQLQALRDGGVAVHVFACDVSGPRRGMKELFQAIKRAMPPIAGIIHAAGVTDDVFLADMSWEQLERVLLPKAVGAWNLHALSTQLELDFFVAYSSATACIGSLGQANYTAANAFLDALCKVRSSQGLPALSVAWGPWAEVGMAERLSEPVQRSIKDRGLAFVGPARNFQLLELLLQDRTMHAIAAKIDWAKYLPRMASAGPSQFLARLQEEHVRDVTVVDADVLALKTRLKECSQQERRAVLMDYLRSVLARVLRFAPGEAIDARRGLFDLGLDSLAVVEVKSRIEQGVGRNISATVMLDFPTLEELTNHLHDELFGKADRARAPNGA